MRLLTCAVLAVLCATLVLGEEDSAVYDDYMEVYALVDECGSKSLMLCLKERALKFIERLPSNIDMGGGVRIRQLEGERASREQHPPLELPTEAAARESLLDELLWDRVFAYLTTHKVEFQLPAETVRGMQRSMEEGRKKKQKGGGGQMMMMIAMKAALLGALALKGIALIAFKALLIAKVALTISLIIALKKLLSQKEHTSTYEVVAHPHHHEDHYDRSFSQDLAYRAYKQKRSQ